tara:strand:- start:703 stop:1287 length:585 start_codon:yes stop_codon:yes gene_type:complete
MKTDLIIDLLAKEGTYIEDNWVKDIPMGRLAHPSELQGTIVWMASDASSYLTGSDIVSSFLSLFLSQIEPNYSNSFHLTFLRLSMAGTPVGEGVIPIPETPARIVTSSLAIMKTIILTLSHEKTYLGLFLCLVMWRSFCFLNSNRSFLLAWLHIEPPNLSCFISVSSPPFHLSESISFLCQILRSSHEGPVPGH